MAEIGGWESVRRAARERIGESASEKWLDCVEGHVEDGQLVLRCPDRFTRDRVRAQYDRVLRDLAAAVEYRVEPELAVPGPPEEPEAPTPPTAGAGSGAFESFVVGPGNALAHEAARAVALGRIGRLNPLVVAGPSGVGKTHLLGALRHEIGHAAVYRSSEEFTVDVTGAIRAREMERIRHRYRTAANVLILEDLQFLEGRKATQVELFHTVDHLLARGRPVVLSSDRPPNELSGLDASLRSRLSQGLVAFIRPPEHETRLRILRERAARGGVGIPEPCLEMLAARPVRSVRDLLAGLNQVVARAALLRQRVSEALVAEALQAVGDASLGGGSFTLDEIIDYVTHAYGVTADELRGRSKQQRLVRPRQIAMYLCRRCTDASLKQIGRRMGRDHTSVMYSISRVEQLCVERPQLRYELETIAARFSPAGSAGGRTRGTRRT